MQALKILGDVVKATPTLPPPIASNCGIYSIKAHVVLSTSNVPPYVSPLSSHHQLYSSKLEPSAPSLVAGVSQCIAAALSSIRQVCACPKQNHSDVPHRSHVCCFTVRLLKP